MFFNGILNVGSLCYYIQRAPFSRLPIGNYLSNEEDSVGDNIWIHSLRNGEVDVYYQLGQPAVEYRRFYEPSLWVADLAKHFVEFCGSRIDKGQQVAWQIYQLKGFKGANIWYALVQRVMLSGNGTRYLDITWLYRPEDTPCGQIKYPWSKELFLSDHYTCGEAGIA